MTSPEETRIPKQRYGVLRENLSWGLMQRIMFAYYVAARGEVCDERTLYSRHRDDYDCLMRGEFLDLRLGTMLNRDTKLYIGEDYRGPISFSVYVNGKTRDEDDPTTEAGRPHFALKDEIEAAMDTQLHEAGVAVPVE